MKCKVRTIVQKVQEIKAGSILIAKPFLENETYKRTVIMILSNSAVSNIGIILNLQSNLRVKDIIPELEVSDRLFFGGPSI